MLRLYMVAAVAGAGAVQLMPLLPARPDVPGAVAAFGLVGFALLRLYQSTRASASAWPCAALAAAAGMLLCFALAASAAAWRAAERLADSLAPEHENHVTRLVLQVVGLPQAVERGRRFEAKVLHSPVAGVPSRLMVGWYGGTAVSEDPQEPVRTALHVMPGQIFSAAVILRRVHGSQNPHAFDFEAWMFERAIRASATVRGYPRSLGDEPWGSFEIAVQRIRHHLRAALLDALGDARYGPVIVALALGDQAGVDAADWAIFNRVGITHLVSISGSHVTMLAALAGLAALWCGKRLRWRGVYLAERLPAQVLAAAVALFVAWLYCLLAGWGVPARRTFFMLALVATAAILRLALSPSRVLAGAAMLITAFDPWAPLAPGFWLSFGAVAVLMLAGIGRWRQPARRRWLASLRAATRLQLSISVALVPLLAMQFHEVSLSSPLANAIAIPVVSAIVTPLSLAAALLAPLPVLGVPGGWLAVAAEVVFRWMMVPVAWLGTAAWSSASVAAPPWPLAALAGGGIVYALQPRGPALRWAGLFLLVPMLFHLPQRPPIGGWRLTALDVGQGTGVIIETASHVLVYDTGPPLGSSADAGERVVWPALRARGHRRVDDLVVSHADADHAGGLASVLKAVPVSRLRASYRPADAVGRHAPWAPCATGQGWTLDGVSFAFLHPGPLPQGRDAHDDTNANSCVLLVQGAHHSALLPGDIGKAQEIALVDRHGEGMQADVVLMAHHGSRSSSEPRFVRAVGAAHAIAQAGYLSRFGHPAPDVVARWQASGALVHRTDLHGAITLSSDAGGLRALRERSVQARYWHGR